MDEFDVLINNGLIVDGTGTPPVKGSLAVKRERITAIGKVKGDAAEVIDAKGFVISPGFIDVHNHGDLSIAYYPRADGFVRQGITTFIGGQCGNSPGPYGDWIGNPWMLRHLHQEVAPTKYDADWFHTRDEVNRVHLVEYGWEIDWNTLGEFFDRIERIGISPNYAPMLGHGEIRGLVIGSDYRRKATRKEIRLMKEHVDQAMRDGCIGLTVGRDYDPGIWADFSEILDCARVAAKFGGVYGSHSLRTGHRKARRPGEPSPIALNGVLEAIDVGRKAKIPVQISHLGSLFTVSPADNRAMTEAANKETLKVVEEAQAEGIDVTFDVIPHHTAGGIFTNPCLAASLMPWLKVAGSLEQLGKALRMPDFRAEIKEVIMAGKHYGLNPNITPNWAEQGTIVECKEKNYLDKSVAQVARNLGVDELEALMLILISDPETKSIRRGSDDWAKIEFYKHPLMMVGIDTFAVDETNIGKGPAPLLPCETSFGGFPRYIRRAYRETNALSLEEAIRKVTSSPARKFRLKDRGVLKPGAYADVVLFDAEKITDKGDPIKPQHYPEGIRLVLVNGVAVVNEDGHTGALPGKVLRRE